MVADSPSYQKDELSVRCYYKRKGIKRPGYRTNNKLEKETYQESET